MTNITLTNAPIEDFYTEVRGMSKEEVANTRVMLQSIIVSLEQRIDSLSKTEESGLGINPYYTEQKRKAEDKHRILTYKLSLLPKPESLWSRLLGFFKRS